MQKFIAFSAFRGVKLRLHNPVDVFPLKSNLFGLLTSVMSHEYVVSRDLVIGHFVAYSSMTERLISVGRDLTLLFQARLFPLSFMP